MNFKSFTSKKYAQRKSPPKEPPNEPPNELPKEDVQRVSPTGKQFQLNLMPFEQDLMMDTFTDDLIFITARGLALESIFLNHLNMYSESDQSVIVLNTTVEDEHFFIEKLKTLSPKYAPKILTADVLGKDRENIYKTGGVQFVTSRIFMVDLLTNRVPLDQVAGILVFRAHEALTGYQESFILRLFREKKEDGFVKAFTDQPSAITRHGLGQLQRLIDRLYVKRARILPRFDDGVKTSFEKTQPLFIEISIDLTPIQRRVRTCLIDIISTCVRDLKQCTHGVELETEEDTVSATAALRPSPLEVELHKNTLTLTDRQERLLNDLKILRRLLEMAENLDPVTVHMFINEMRSDKEFVEKNSGWMFSPTANKVFEAIKSQCSAKDEHGQTTITAPPKWNSLETVLNEIKEEMSKDPSFDPTNQPPVLILASNESTCAQLLDLVKFGVRKLCWLRGKQYASMEGKPFNSTEPISNPIWPTDFVALYDDQILEQDKKQLVREIKKDQKKEGRAKVKKRKPIAVAADADPKQPKLVSFGLIRYTEKKSDKNRPAKVNAGDYIKKLETFEKEPAQSSSKKVEEDQEIVCLDDLPPTVVSEPFGENLQLLPLLLFSTLRNRYNLINCLESLKPRYVILYHSDIACTRIIECFTGHNNLSNVKLYALSYTSSTEEERYLTSIQNEQNALTTLLRDQEILYIPTEYDTTREDASQLRALAVLPSDSRRNRRILPDIEEDKPMVIVDMREFNSELPTIIYKNGIDLLPATLEVGDYILSPTICIERKALDDLTQSLINGRVFKQIEQMLRHYPNSVLLIESSEKFRRHRANSGPFQGDLSRRSRDTRSLLTMLIRANPKLSILWSLSPSHSSEFFEELKLKEPNPELDKALAIRSDDLGVDDDGNETSCKINSVARRQLQTLPIFTPMDIERAMRSKKLTTIADFIQADASTLKEAAGVTQQQAQSLIDLLKKDFRTISV